MITNTDITPSGYLLFYSNMNLASMYMIPTILVGILLLVGYCCLRDNNQKNDGNINVVSTDSD